MYMIYQNMYFDSRKSFYFKPGDFLSALSLISRGATQRLSPSAWMKWDRQSNSR